MIYNAIIYNNQKHPVNLAARALHKKVQKVCPIVLLLEHGLRRSRYFKAGWMGHCCAESVVEMKSTLRTEF